MFVKRNEGESTQPDCTCLCTCRHERMPFHLRVQDVNRRIRTEMVMLTLYTMTCQGSHFRVQYVIVDSGKKLSC